MTLVLERVMALHNLVFSYAIKTINEIEVFETIMIIGFVHFLELQNIGIRMLASGDKCIHSKGLADKTMARCYG